MISNLTRYTSTGHFLFNSIDNLNRVCNAPIDKAGIYLIYAGDVNSELLYIGCSGRIKKDGLLFIRKGGIKDRLVNGKRDKELRRIFWLREMQKLEINTLDIYWFVTHGEKFIDCPKKIEDILLKIYKDTYGRQPLWNRK